MERFLITLSLGPVQSLIGAARRTRDLWCGSWLLSEAARAAAHALHNQQKNCLIFPRLKNPDKDLKPQKNPWGYCKYREHSAGRGYDGRRRGRSCALR